MQTVVTNFRTATLIGVIKNYSPTNFKKMKKFLSFAALAMFAISFSAFTTNKTAMPDLCIENVKVVCEAQRWLVFEVYNAGTVASNPTLIRIRPEGGDDPTQRCIQTAVRNVPIIQPGRYFKLRVELNNTVGCDCKSTLKFELVVDHKNYVQEADETNNKKMFSVN